MVWEFFFRSDVVFEEPVVEAVDNAHERGLIEIAADSGGDPGLLAVGVEADSDADVGGGIMSAHIERGNSKGPEADLSKCGIGALEFFTHRLGEGVDWAVAFSAAGGEFALAD